MNETRTLDSIKQSKSLWSQHEAIMSSTYNIHNPIRANLDHYHNYCNKDGVMPYMRA